MTALAAAAVQVIDARRYLAGRLEFAADELRRQAAQVRAGGHYQARIVAHRVTSIEEALQILDASQECELRLRQIGAGAA